jgi:two-component system, NarL family, sensor histidine kinase UhpB
MEPTAVPVRAVAARDGGDSRARPVGFPRSLAWRVFLSNAAVLLGVFAFYAVSPATISEPVLTSELLVLVCALTVTLFVDLVLLGRVFRPLDRLRGLMYEVDPLRPGRRIDVGPADADVSALASAFNAMLDRLETERRDSARRALNAQEEERARVARELHDELGQVLTGLLLLIDDASRSDGHHAQAVMVEAREAARGAIDDVRRIVRDLRPEALDDLGLAAALRALARDVERRAEISIELRIDPELPPLAADQELVVYRVVQEALTNVARHAAAEHAALVVEARDGALRVAVRDDGRGFRGLPPDDGGIRGMRERALLVRGRVTVESTAGIGTDVVLSLPVPEP